MSTPHIPTLREFERREAALKRQAQVAQHDSKGKIPSLPPPPKARERALLALPAPMPVSLDTANTINMETEQRTVLWEAYEKGKAEQAIAAQAKPFVVIPRRNLNMPPRGRSHPLLQPRPVTEHAAPQPPVLKTVWGLPPEQLAIRICIAIILAALGFALANFLGSHS